MGTSGKKKKKKVKISLKLSPMNGMEYSGDLLPL